MPREVVQVSATFLLALGSAVFFLFLRCHGHGRPFGRHSRGWALLVVVTTSLVSTGAAFAGVLILAHLPFALTGLGVIGPSGLWLSEIHHRREEQRSPGRDASTLWLTRMLARLGEGMAEDRMNWCEHRVDEAWSTDELGMAARFYQQYMRERMTGEERRRSRIFARVTAIENRLAVVQLIENSAGRPKVTSALRGSRAIKDDRYNGYLDDLARMADILRHDAERDLIRLLGHAYGAGLYRMPVFAPPRRLHRAIENPADRSSAVRRQAQPT
ncbi:MAG TPA: hypothetical protein VI159_03825 [Gemmatimonadales bacterium]